MTSEFRKRPIGLIILILISLVFCEEGSLRSALKAINRKQHVLPDYPRNGEFYSEGGLSRYNYESDDNDELAFLNQDVDYDQDSKNKNPYYTGKNDMLEVDGNENKRISSSFRERIEEDRAHRRKKMEDTLFNKLQEDQSENELEQYDELMQLWDKYTNTYPDGIGNAKHPIQMSDYNPNFDADATKRSRYFQPDGPSESLYFLNYTPRDEVFNRLQEDPEFQITKQPQSQYSYSPLKRFPVTKRSSSYYPIPYNSEFNHHHKRSSLKEHVFRTDPKVEKDLSNIFSPKSKRSNGSTKKKEKVSKKPTHIDKKQKTKEIVPVVHKEEPLQIEKKSIDWSDYFGLDRRKKSEDIDNEWLMERYHKAVAMAAKRNSGQSEQNKKIKQTLDEIKIGEIDSKLKNMEDSIIDDTLKYTGAHEGASDSKEIQEVKDRVISQLAAAYSLEKMRRALGEYKKNIEKQMDRLKELTQQDHTYSEEKRLSVPRKSAIDEERQKIGDADNNIKCTYADEECTEQNYKVPNDLVEQADWDREPCPKVQRACNEVASTLGHYGRSFESACAIHQKCLLCGDNRWFAPTRQCNVLFLTKADEICNNDVECQRVARHSVRYLIDVNRSLKAEPMEVCQLVCPDKRR